MPFDVNGALQEGHTLPEIADYLAAKSGFDIGGARKEGYADNDIVAHLSGASAQAAPASSNPTPPPAAPDASLGGSLQAGASGAMTSLGQAGQDMGTLANSAGLPTLGGYLQSGGKFLQSHAPAAPANYQAPHPVNKLMQGDFSGAGWDALRMGAEMAPGVAGTVAAAGINPALGVATGAALTEPGIARARAANDGRSEPSTGDIGIGLGAGLLSGAAGSAAGRVGGGILRKTGAELAAGPAMEAVNETAGSAGTDKGLQLDPEAIADAGVGAGVARAGMAVPGLAKAGVKGVADRAMASTLDKPATTADAQSVMRVNAAMDQARQNAINNKGSDYSDTVIANNVKDELESNLTETARTLKDNNLIAPDEFRDLQGLIRDQAYRHNNTMTTGTPGVRSLFDAIDNLPIAPALKETLQNGVRDLNTVKTQSFQKNTVGPGQKVGEWLGLAGDVGGSLASGHLMGLLGAIGGRHGPAGVIGGQIGRVVDRALGTNTPTITLQQGNAERMLRSMGVAPDTSNPIADLQSFRAGYANPNTVTGLPPNPVPVNTPTRVPTPAPTPQTAPQAAPQAPPAAPVAPPVATQPPAPQAPPAAPQAPQAAPAPQAPQRPLWSRLVANGNGAVTHDEALQAATLAEMKGTIPQGTVALLQGHTGGIDPTHRAAIQAELPAQLRAVQAGAAVNAGPGREPVRDPFRWNAAREDVKDHVEAVAQQADKIDPALGMAIRRVGIEPTAAEKQAIMATHMATVPPAAHKLHRAMFTPRMMKGV